MSSLDDSYMLRSTFGLAARTLAQNKSEEETEKLVRTVSSWEEAAVLR